MFTISIDELRRKIDTIAETEDKVEAGELINSLFGVSLLEIAINDEVEFVIDNHISESELDRNEYNIDTFSITKDVIDNEYPLGYVMEYIHETVEEKFNI